MLRGRKCKQQDDCLAACINTLMNRDDCPHFFDGRDGEWAWGRLREWMRQHGKDLMLFPYSEDPRPIMDDTLNEGYYLLICRTGGDDHAVICKGSEVVFDPAWLPGSVNGPAGCGFWVVGVVVDRLP